MLTHDHDDNSPLFLDLFLLLAIFTFWKVASKMIRVKLTITTTKIIHKTITKTK